MRSRRWKFAASLGLLLCLSASIAVGGFAADASVAEQKGYPGGGGDWPPPMPPIENPDGAPWGSFEHKGHYYFVNGWTKEADATCVSAEKWVNKCVWTYGDGSQCGKEWVEWRGKKDPNNHVNTITINEKKATCTEEGYSGDLYCKDCNKLLKKGETIPKTDHKWDKGKVTTKPTCTEPGVKTYTCTRCKTTRTETIAKTGHDPIAVPGKEPTCTETGLTEGKECKICGATLVEQKEIPALDHDWDDWKVTKEATCTEPGVKTRTCKRDASHTETEPIPKTGHNYTEKVVPPTCESDGYTIFTCNNCGDIYTGNVTAKLGHDYQLKDHKDATCTEAGYDYYECSRDALHNYTEAIPALGHDWNTTSTGVDNCVNVSFRHENETITLCPICGVQNGTQRLNKVTLYTAHAKLVVLRGVLENGMEAMTVAFYEPGISSVTACQRCGAVRDSFSSGASLPQAAENAHFTVDASLVDGYTVMLVQADGTETVLTPGISDGKAIFDVDMKGQGARLLHLVPTTAA